MTCAVKVPATNLEVEHCPETPWELGLIAQALRSAGQRGLQQVVVAEW